MAEENSKKGASSLLNLNSLLALLTLVAGFWLVSQRLTSSRPVAQAGDAAALGEQTLNARLWEDPFKDAPAAPAAEKEAKLKPSALEPLLAQLRERYSGGKSDVLILPVMLSGGQYSEDRESRIRGRYAVISGLGRMGFVPEDSEHIGSLKIPWPTNAEIRQAAGAQGRPFARLWPKDESSFTDTVFAHGASSSMDLRFEWCRARAFIRGASWWESRKAVPITVLVLWLDDSYFEVEPMLRLPLLFEPLLDALPLVKPDPEDANKPKRRSDTIALIGPWRSATLRSMVPTWGKVTPGAEDPLKVYYAEPSLRSLIHQNLDRVSLYCATPSVMDEVLEAESSSTVRENVGQHLRNAGFHSFHNVTATDADLAHEVLAELQLRQARLDGGETPGHLVLISEWDTFYARMMGLTYGAELSILKRESATRQDYVDRYIRSSPGRRCAPDNFHTFVYLRGLDGQTVGKEVEADAAGGKGSLRGLASPASIEDLRHWTPDSNKAQGQAQFDYLARLGDQIAELEARLKRDKLGRVTAIGIVGSDVFDTLLILQALRDKFPNALFFTTDLDVRLTHSSEREWARNLIVASSYGLALAPELQGEIAPFRDSKQTALYVATLAALNEPQLANLITVPVRRFEIGNNEAVDISTLGPLADAKLPDPRRPRATAADEPPAHLARFALHPETTQERLFESEVVLRKNRLWALLVGALAVAGLCWLIPALRNLSYNCLKYSGEALVYTEEDIGGPDGGEYFANQIVRGSSGKGAVWLSGYLGEMRTCPATVNRTELDPAAIDEMERDTAKQRKLLAQQQEKWRCELARRMVTGLNYLIDRWEPHKPPPPATTLAKGPWEWPLARHRRRRAVRRILDQELKTMSAFPRGKDERHEAPVLIAAKCAREAAEEIYRLRIWRLAWIAVCIGGMGYLGAKLGAAIWYDSIFNAKGEPLSLLSGVSAWPAQIVRFLVAALAVVFLLLLFFNGRENFYRLSRAYRLRATGQPDPQMPDGTVCAENIWYDYRVGRGKLRIVWRVFQPLAAYIGAAAIIVLVLGDEPISPVRDKLASEWNLKLLGASVLGFLALTFVTLDAARSGSRFIRKLIGAPTRYPEATRRHFSRTRGDINPEYLDEWIDLQLIADLTEYLSTLVYFPSILFVLLIAARNSWWDRWPWPPALLVIFAMNFLIAAAGIVMLQRAAQLAKRDAEASLDAKIKRLGSWLAASPAENDQSQAGKLLEEIRGIERGAFVSFWNSPVVGALFLSSGGTTAIQALIWFMGR